MFNSFVLVISLVPVALGGRAATWDICGCYWGTWKPWSSCTAKCGGGTQTREREVWNYDTPNCEGFNTCATNDLGWDRKQCNTNCYNGGTFRTSYSIYGYCTCKKGNKGDCCEQIMLNSFTSFLHFACGASYYNGTTIDFPLVNQQSSIFVNCGTPSRISNGTFNGEDYTYGKTVLYTCTDGYNMTNPANADRTCTENGFWSGRNPICLYAVSCNSSPCQNGGICSDTLGGYVCSCVEGWTGKNCDIDIQPPVVDACPKSRVIHTSNLTHTEKWIAPSFTDPFGGKVVVAKNYQSSTFTFPWGNYTVQYSAVKPSNGLRNDCQFEIAVQPHACTAIDVPKNGILVCNGWQTTYTKVCKLLCKEGFAFPPGFSSTDWYNCAASGYWLPGNPLTKCVSGDMRMAGSPPSKFYCSDKTNIQEIATHYVDELKQSGFRNLCETHKDECTIQHVDVMC